MSNLENQDDNIIPEEHLAELGFEESLSFPDVRLMNKDGSLNVAFEGEETFKSRSLYKEFVMMPASVFFGSILFGYIILNVIFATGFYVLGPDALTSSKDHISWLDCFWFSTQTFTTLGYGHISPATFLSNLLASFEAFVGLIFFAVATGLVYGRFSTSKTKIRFSDNILIGQSPQGNNNLTLRLVNISNNELSDLEATLIVSFIEKQNGVLVRKYNKLPLALPSISMLTTSWTIVHEIDDASPCQILNKRKNIQGLEFLLFISAFDEVFDQKIKVRTSYLGEDVVYNARFEPITTYKEHKAIVDIHKLSSYREI